MVSTRALAILGLAFTLAVACKSINPAYCDDHPGDGDCPRDAGPLIDAPVRPDAAGCAGDRQCPAGAPVCEVARGACVECTAAEPAACAGASPVCGADDTCRGCTADAECASLACLPGGACAVVGSVLYAAPAPVGSATASCTADAPCTIERAVALVDAARSTVRLAPGRYDLGGSLTLAASLRLVGRGAVIDREAIGTGATLVVGDGTAVELDYVTIEGGDGDSTGFGIACSAAALTGREITIDGNAAAGIHGVGCDLELSHAWIAMNQGPGIAASGGRLDLARSTVIGNQAGGLMVSAAEFDLHNDMIVKNGSATSGFGGVLISQITIRDAHAFEFNTVAQNQATAGSTPGVICSVVTAPLVFDSDIVFDNADGAQVEGGNCAWTYSDIGPVPVSGTGNLASDPAFMAPAQNNFHLQVASPLRDAADPAATLADDIDGDARPQGSGRDVGADEIP